MALGSTIQLVANSYAAAITTPLAGNSLASIIRDDLRAELTTSLAGDGAGMVLKSSAGNGNWAEVPWAAIFDPAVTTSATRGFYPVYLFDISGGKVHLSLNQGTTAVREEFGSRAPSVLAKRAELMRDRLNDFRTGLPVTSITLPGGRLAQDYGSGHAVGKTYLVGSLPSDVELAADLASMISAYRALIFRGGLDFDPASDSATTPSAIDEERKYRAHRRIERNRKAAELVKRHHGTTCQCCNLSFPHRYGSVGDGFIEVHHLVPIAELAEGTKVSYSIASDFAVLCANCHRMIHRMPDTSDVAALRAVLIQ